MSIIISISPLGENIISLLESSKKGKLTLEEEKDYFDNQKVLNLRTPLTRELVINQICDPQIDFKKLISSYVLPLEKEAFFYKLIQPLKVFIKKRNEKQ